MNLAISGIGMITSVGRNVTQSCASIRAGISRPREISYFQGLDPLTQESEPIKGHPIRVLSEGFLLVGLWLRMAKECLSDMLDYGGLPAASDSDYWQQTAIIAVLPFINDDRSLAVGDETPDRVLEPYLYPLHEWFSRPIDKKNLYPICSDTTGTVEAIQLANELISSARVERVIVVAVDSYLDSLSLEWLASKNRLKSPENPVGVMPGEAGACFMLESLATCKNRNALIYAMIVGTGMGLEANHYESEGQNMGVGLSKAVLKALEARAGKLPFAGDLVSDFNGEQWRALELAGARMLLRDNIHEMCPVILPAVSIGDAGAANGAVEFCMAVRSFVRGYSAANESIILMSTQCGRVGAVLLRQMT